MPNDLSEECKKRLRDIEGQLNYTLSDPAKVTQRLTGAYPHLLNLMKAARDDVDDRCREVLRGIEPEIQSIETEIQNLPQEHVVATLRKCHAVFQYIVRQFD